MSVVNSRQLHLINEDVFVFVITLNNDLALFKEHFPNNPILPGAYILTIINELASQIFELKILGKYRLSEIKGTSFINPVQPQFSLKVDCRLKFRSESELDLSFIFLNLQDGSHYAQGLFHYVREES